MKQKIIQMQSLLLALLLAGLLTLLEEKVFQNPQGYLVLVQLEVGGARLVSALVTTLASFFLLVFFVWLGLSLPRGWRWTLAVIFTVAMLVEFNYWEIFHREFTVNDMAVAIGAPLRMWNDSMNIFFNWLSLVPILAFVAVMAAPGQPDKKRAGWLGVALASCIGVNLLAGGLHTPVNWGTSLAKFYRTAVQWSLSGVQHVPREEISYQAPNGAKPANNVVLIIDESIRADHLSLNGYNRPTTPRLDELAEQTGLVYNWGTAAAGATCSADSNHLLITGVFISAADDPDFRDEMKRYPTIFQYAKAMGYQTAYLDAQTLYLWNGLSPEDLHFVDQWLTKDDLGGGLDVDQKAADWIFQTISHSTGNFIVLNKQGAHYLYENSYPGSEAIWGPIPADYHQQPELVRNPYDNSIRYTVNGFFEHLFAGEAAYENTVYVYTSDHAQTLFENGVDWLHCNYTRTEASVPLMLIGRLPAELDLSYPAGHANIFATLLDLMQVPEEARLHEYAPSLFAAGTARAVPRFFLSGSGKIFPYD
jgi:lipid A ethanolaminephosphotransferase